MEIRSDFLNDTGFFEDFANQFRFCSEFVLIEDCENIPEETVFKFIDLTDID